MAGASRSCSFCSVYYSLLLVLAKNECLRDVCKRERARTHSRIVVDVGRFFSVDRVTTRVCVCEVNEYNHNKNMKERRE